MPSKPLKVDSLDLDLENPRIALATDQRDAMQKILDEQEVRLINLAESIASRGLNPMDRFLVIRSALHQKRFTVLEGNRRVLALKLLKNPAVLSTFRLSRSHARRLLRASEGFDLNAIEPLDCFEVLDRTEGTEWIRQRHSGSDKGRGIVDWSSIAGARFRGRAPALQALDFVLQHGKLTDDQTELITTASYITTLSRLILNPSVRSAIGLEMFAGKLRTSLPPEEIIKPLKQVVLDLAEKKIVVTDVKLKGQQEAYIAKLGGAHKPNFSQMRDTLVELEGISSRDFQKVPTVVNRSVSPRKEKRTAVVPRTCQLSITVPKIEGIYIELKSLDLAKHVHSISVLMRVFLEMSVDDYLENKAGSTLFLPERRNGHLVDKKLKDKVQEVIEHLASKGNSESDFKGVKSALGDSGNPFSIDTLHAYIHNRFFTPTDKHLVTGWDNAQRFFEKVWPC